MIILVHRWSCALGVSYKAERDVMLYSNGKQTTVAKGERILVVRSRKWKKLSVAEVGTSAPLSLIKDM